MRTQLKLIFAALFFAGFGISLWTSMHRESAPAAPVIDLDRTPASEEPVSPSALAHEYRFYREIHAKMENQKPLLDLILDGKVWMTELSISATSTRYSLQFEMKAQGQESIQRSTIPCVMEISKESDLISFQARKANDKAEEDQLHLLKDFATLFAYRSHEDTTGKFEYTWKGDYTGGVKVKTKYLGETLKNARILSSQHRVELEQATRVVSKIKGSDEVNLSGQASEGMRTKSIYIISSLGKVKKAGIVFQESSLKKESLQLSSRFKELRLSDWEILKSKLIELESFDKTARMTLFHELVKSLKEDPSKVSEFASLMEGLKERPGFLTFGIGVLATVGSGEAQAKLLSWYRERSEKGQGGETGHIILNALSMTSAELTADTKQFLLSLTADAHSDVVDHATLTLGAALKRSPDSQVESKLSEILAKSSGPARLNAIEAIGNSGDTNLLPNLRAYLFSANPTEKASAVFALRFMKPEVVAPYLLASYRDSDVSVRHASIRAIQFQSDLTPYLSFLKSCANAGDGDCARLVNK